MAITRRACSFRPPRQALLLILLLSVAACAPHAPADDFTISTQVKIELLADPDLGGRRIDVSSLDGIVTLSGSVASAADAERAAAAAKRVHGVRAVKSELKVAGS